MYPLTRPRTTPQIPLLHLNLRPDIKIEDIHRHTDGRAGVGKIDDAGDVALDGGAREEEVDLVVVVAWLR